MFDNLLKIYCPTSTLEKYYRVFISRWPYTTRLYITGFHLSFDLVTNAFITITIFEGVTIWSNAVISPNQHFLSFESENFLDF